MRIRRWNVYDEVQGILKIMGIHGLVMVEKDHENDDEDFCANTNIIKSDKLLHILPKLWPYSQDINFMVLLNPKWSITKTSCLVWKILSCARPLKTYKRPSR
jgi:hypothetical protein